ncbi:MAG: hypothetical protein N2053_01790 [Chitinispirillaceae bacterium]|nr:hypothetical protein [Chitinispirillaceae bacterium]
MKKIKKFLLLISFILLSGCYTQLMVVEKREPPKEEVVWEIDSATGDTVKVIKRVDTVKTKEREICVWRRDLLGYPYLYCYESYYPRDWFYYNYSPWWYRNDPFWYDYYRCPRFYYYDPSCGCCRYYSGRSYRGGTSYEKDEGGSSFVPSEPSGSSYKTRVRGVPEGGRAITNTSEKETKADNSSNKEQTEKGKIVVSPDKNDARVVRERGKGVPEGGEKIESSSPQKSAGDVAPSSTSQGEHHISQPPATGNSTSSSSSSTNDSEEKREPPSLIRNPRSW